MVQFNLVVGKYGMVTKLDGIGWEGRDGTGLVASGMGWDGISCQWDGMGRDQMSKNLNGMGWDGIGDEWDGMGRDPFSVPSQGSASDADSLNTRTASLWSTL